MSTRRLTMHIFHSLFLFYWLCSQALCFAVPAISSATNQASPGWEQGSPEDQCRDRGFQSELGYDAESSDVATKALTDGIGIMPTTPAYDSASVSPIRIAGIPHTPTVRKAGLLAAKTLDPNKIRFSQDSIKAGFQDATQGSIDDLAPGLRNKTIDLNSIPLIRLVEREGNLISIDNRRLEAFRRAGVEVPTRMATPAEIQQAIQQGKFSAAELGTPTIRVRGE